MRSRRRARTLAIVTGSGPTAVGLCRDRPQAEAVAGALAPGMAGGASESIVCEAGQALMELPKDRRGLAQGHRRRRR